MPAQRLLRLLPTDSFLGAAFGAAVPISKETASGLEKGKLVWLHAAYEGEFKGYRFPMALTKEFFASLIANIHRDPQFKAGEDGYGTAPVVRMDYEHVSAMPPTEGSIPEKGAPAPGWVCDAEMRPGDGGRTDFWVLCELGEKLAEQIQKREQRFLSIDAPLKSKDPVSGEDRGPKLRALAVTNDPFLRDLEPMSIAASASVYGRAESPEELVIGLRQILQLTEDADTAAIQTALTELGAAYDAGMRAPGYPDGFGYLIDSVRQLVGLPVLATCSEIIAAAGQALGALSASTSTTPETPEGTAMATNPLNAKLSVLFNCAESDEAILAAATKSSGAFSVLETMMKDYGAADPADLVKKAGDAAKKATMAAEAGTKLAELLSTLNADAETASAAEAEQIAASWGFKKDDPRGVGARSNITATGLAARRAKLGINVDPDGKTLTLGARDESKFEQYRKDYPLPSGEQQQAALLTSSIVATPGAQLGGAHTALPAGGGANPGTKTPAMPKHLEDIATYPGRNHVEKAIAMLSAKDEGFKLQTWNEKCRLAGNYVLTGKAA